jgi:sugar phosphate isomerase/epimerase
MKETQARLADTGIEVLDIELFRMDPTLEPESFIPVLDAAAELGAKHIIAQLPDPDRKRATDRFARMCDLAKPLGIFVSLEFPHWTETGNLATAAKVVRDVKRSNAGILVDMLHMGRSTRARTNSPSCRAEVVPLCARLRRRQGGTSDD